MDIKRLEEINAATGVPLVLHGGSGIPDDQLMIAFSKGVNKFNVGTEFLNDYYSAIQDFVKNERKRSSLFEASRSSLLCAGSHEIWRAKCSCAIFNAVFRGFGQGRYPSDYL